jgi:hypothetical protein
MRTTTLTVASLAGLALVGSVACRTATVRNVPRTGVSTPAPVTMQEMTDAIWAAGRREGWRMREVAPGQMRAEKQVRDHRAVSQIDYDTAGFSITLVSADNLLHQGNTIHKTYNLWVEQLEKSIKDEIQFRFR